jgi:hypothetical protein
MSGFRKPLKKNLPAALTFHLIVGIFGVCLLLSVFFFLLPALPSSPFIPPHSVVILLPQRTRVLFCRLLYSLPLRLWVAFFLLFSSLEVLLFPSIPLLLACVFPNAKSSHYLHYICFSLLLCGLLLVFKH